MKFIRCLLIVCFVLFPVGESSALGVKGKGGFLKKLLLEPSFFSSVFKDKVADLSFGFDLQLLSLEIMQGLGLAVAYRYQVAPAYHEEYHARIDQWRMNRALNPGDIIQDALNLPIQFQVDRGQEIVFVRFFPTKNEAYKASPYQLQQVPINAKRVLQYLSPGDLVAIPAKLNLLVQAQVAQKFGGLLKAKIGSHLMF